MKIPQQHIVGEIFKRFSYDFSLYSFKCQTAEILIFYLCILMFCKMMILLKMKT